MSEATSNPVPGKAGGAIPASHPGIAAVPVRLPIERAVGWYAYAPNALTLARLGLASGFFVCLALYRFPNSRPWLLLAGFVLFIAAALTDALDGWLARRWNAVTVFGRIMDPFADKVLVLGAFIFLAGPNFAPDYPVFPAPKTTLTVSPVSGVDPWMVAVLLARELLVTSIRAVLESHGVSFAADIFGKLKMLLQAAAVPTILMAIWLGTAGHDWVSPAEQGHPLPHWCRLTIDIVVRATIVLTVLSALPYIWRGWTETVKLSRREGAGPGPRPTDEGND